MALTPTEEAQTRELLAQQAAILSLADSEATIISKLGATKVNLSQLPAATLVADADLLLLRQGTTDKSVSGSIVKSYTKPADATESTSGVVELATDSETSAGTDATRVVSPAKLKLGFSISLAPNGYIKFPSWLGGAIIQWGINTGSASATTTVSFPLAFPNACFIVVGSVDGASNYSFTRESTPTTSQFTFGCYNTSNARTAQQARWIAVGY